MICDLSSVLNNDGAELDFSGQIDIGTETEDLGITFPDGAKVFGKIVCRGDVLELSAHVDGEFLTNCARCLKELTIPVSFDFAETLTQNEDAIEDKDSVILFEGTTIDMSELVIGNLLLNLSYKYLCSEECLGICPKCGTDLNTGSCDCTDDEIDPRWEILKNFK